MNWNILKVFIFKFISILTILCIFNEENKSINTLLKKEKLKYKMYLLTLLIILLSYLPLYIFTAYKKINQSYIFIYLPFYCGKTCISKYLKKSG